MPSGIIFINRNGWRSRDAPKAYGPHKALSNRWKRWSDKGVFAQMMAVLAAERGDRKTLMSGATYLEAHRTATSMGVKGGRGRLIDRTKGFEGRRNCPGDSFARGRNTKLNAICDSQNRPLAPLVTAGQVSDDIGARALPSSLPDFSWLLGGRG